MKDKLFKGLNKSLRGFIRAAQVDTDRSFLLEFNCDGILKICGISDISEYTARHIIAVSDIYITEISGESLEIQSCRDTEISVSGEIFSIEFIRR